MKYYLLLIVAVLAGCVQGGDMMPTPAGETRAATEMSPEIPRGKATLYGLFSERGKGWTSKTKDSSTGKLIRKPTLEFVEQTDRIPLRKGVIFGYKYWIKIESDKSRAKFKRVLKHPEMTLPDGSRVSRSERKIQKRTTYGIVTALDAYALSEDYELVAGDWAFQLWYQDKLLVEQTFTTYWPEPDNGPDANNGKGERRHP